MSLQRKVLMLTPGLNIGGLERMILNLSRSLKSSLRWEPEVLAYDFSITDRPTLMEAFSSFGIPVEANKKPPRFSFETAKNLAQKSTRDGIAVIHTHDLGALIYGSVAKILMSGRARVVHTQHSFVDIDKSLKYRRYEKFFSKFADEIAVVSEDTRHSYLKLGVPARKLHIIPNGVAFPDAPELDRSGRVALRGALFPSLSTSNDFWLLYLARIHPGKGQDHALKLWSELSPTARRQMQLIFVGPDSGDGELGRLKNIVARGPDPDRVVFAGSAPNPEKWLQASDLFLSCSDFEGMPLAPVEACGSGIPTVLSAIAGHEFLEKAADLFSLDHTEQGARQIEAALARTQSNPARFREDLWHRSASIRESFTLKAMTSKYENLYLSKASSPAESAA